MWQRQNRGGQSGAGQRGILTVGLKSRQWGTGGLCLMVWRQGSGWFWGRLWACLACSPFSAAVNPLPAPGHNGVREGGGLAQIREEQRKPERAARSWGSEKAHRRAGTRKVPLRAPALEALWPKCCPFQALGPWANPPNSQRLPLTRPAPGKTGSAHSPEGDCL